MAQEEDVKSRLQELQKQLAKKQMFVESVSNIGSLLQQRYPSASPSLQELGPKPSFKYLGSDDGLSLMEAKYPAL